MRITIENTKEGLNNFIRRIGYIPLCQNENGEYVFYRKLGGGDYPRFHIYARIEPSGALGINLHLDQKQASYGHYTRHSGEYDTELVSQEAERIKSLLTENR